MASESNKCFSSWFLKATNEDRIFPHFEQGAFCRLLVWLLLCWWRTWRSKYSWILNFLSQITHGSSSDSGTSSCFTLIWLRSLWVDEKISKHTSHWWICFWVLDCLTILAFIVGGFLVQALTSCTSSSIVSSYSIISYVSYSSFSSIISSSTKAASSISAPSICRWKNSSATRAIFLSFAAFVRSTSQVEQIKDVLCCTLKKMSEIVI